jgi:hypothetical protein
MDDAESRLASGWKPCRRTVEVCAKLVESCDSDDGVNDNWSAGYSDAMLVAAKAIRALGSAQ